MTGLEHRAVYPGSIEIRQRRGGRREVRGKFPYGATATIRNRGRVRKERFKSRAFRFSVSGAGRRREVNLLVGHDYGRPLASRGAGTLELADTDAALEFLAELPRDSEQPSWVRDGVLSIEAGLMRGLSPGFSVPPASVVPNAERLVPEPGNPGVDIREIEEAVLLELSVVTRPAYKGAGVDIRAAELEQAEWEAVFGAGGLGQTGETRGETEPPAGDGRVKGVRLWL